MTWRAPRGAVRTRRADGAASPTLVLSVLAGVLAVTFLVLLGFRVFGDDDTPGSDATSVAQASRLEAVEKAAREATVAFLDIDYRDMTPRAERMLALATGTFREQYADAQKNLAAAAAQGKAMSEGEVRYVGISSVGDTSARAFVAADATVSNSVIEAAKAKGQAVDDKKVYRFQLDLSLVKGTWLVNDLRFVG